ncbi:MAG: DUF4878 domain-containing protein [Oscillospiraceae bacterium]|nr:DUF4878 domain-containing protein [Oscillospiraceae bacterium]
MAFNLLRRWSPEYALNEAYADVKEEGLNGLKKHLTSNALKTIEKVESIATLGTLFMGSNPSTLLLNKMSEFEYSVKDILKGSDTARCVVEFNYKDNVTGTIEIKMIKEEQEWRIDNLENPHFDKFEFPAKESSEL